MVEQYYDVQKLRVETFNRIVAYVKSCSASQKFSEARHLCASQEPNEAQVSLASHLQTATHSKCASQRSCEIQNSSASRKKHETQPYIASQPTTETHVQGASHHSPETHEKGAAKPSVTAHRIVKGEVAVPAEIGNLVWYHNRLYETEKELAKKLDAWSRNHPLRINFLSRIQGIGPVLSSGLIAWLSPIKRFPNISKLWKYCGLAPGQKRRRGQKLGYNPHLKTLMWKVAASFEKQKPTKSFYRRVYDEKKNYYLNRKDLREAVEKGVKGAKLHIRLLTMRYVAKRFLADMWVNWRKIEGLPITKPYAHTVLGHTDYAAWKPDK